MACKFVVAEDAKLYGPGHLFLPTETDAQINISSIRKTSVDKKPAMPTGFDSGVTSHDGFSTADREVSRVLSR